MNRIWTVALTAIAVSAPALVAAALLSTNESARVRRARQGDVAGSIPAIRADIDKAQGWPWRVCAGNSESKAGSRAHDARLPRDFPCVDNESARVRCGRTHSNRETTSVIDRPVSYSAALKDGKQQSGRLKMLEPVSSPATRADILWRAICEVESGGNPNAYNEREQAAGIVQIRPILVRDIGRIVGHAHFSLRDRFDPDKSREMFRVYAAHYGRIGSDEEAARCWNGGPRGMRKQATVKYWVKVKAKMERLR